MKVGEEKAVGAREIMAFAVQREVGKED